jgi:GTP-binding protein Era
MEVQHSELEEIPRLHVGFVALVGKPNVGKSTLLNSVLQQKVAIVSWRPQTTRVPLRGILNRADAQVIFIDTPGIHEPRHELGHFMVKLATQSIPNADVVCMMVDISTPPTNLDKRIAQLVNEARVPHLLVLNKVDVRPRGGVHLEAYRELGTWEMELAISAHTGLGVPSFVDEIVVRLPVGEPLYPEDWIADQSVQNLAAELVREKVLHFTRQEVPHAVAVEAEEWEEHDTTTYIRMSINVEKPSQKRIIIGTGGAMLKRIGSAARADIERMVERKVYLDLWVKVRPNWRNDPSSLGWLGYRTRDYER